MKTIGKLLIILVAATVVIGATWAVGQTSGNTAFSGGRARPELSDAEGRPAPPDGEFRERGGGADHHAAQVFSLRGWLGFGQTLVPIAIIVTLVALPTNLWKRRNRSKRRNAAAIQM